MTKEEIRLILIRIMVNTEPYKTSIEKLIKDVQILTDFIKGKY